MGSGGIEVRHTGDTDSDVCSRSEDGANIYLRLSESDLEAAGDYGGGELGHHPRDGPEEAE